MVTVAMAWCRVVAAVATGAEEAEEVEMVTVAAVAEGAEVAAETAMVAAVASVARATATVQVGGRAEAVSPAATLPSSTRAAQPPSDTGLSTASAQQVVASRTPQRSCRHSSP